MNGPHHKLDMRDVNARYAEVHEDACVSDRASVGAPAEWRGRDTLFPVQVHARVMVSEFARVHGGCDRPTVIGEDTWLMAGCHVGHDVQIGEMCDIAPNAVIGGCVTIGDQVKIGIGATVNPWVTIGDRARIGANSTVIRDIPAGETWVGNPARKISTAPPLPDTIREMLDYQDGAA